VIAVGRPLVQQLLDIGVHAEKIELIWNGVDPTEFHPGVPDRAAFGLPANGLLALFAGDIRTPRKNLDTVLRALQQLPALSLVVAGAVERSPYPALARELGIEERVHFLGQVKSIDLLMRSVDMFVFPSRYEAHPLVLLEAIASGLPSIVSNTFGAEEFLGGAGFILDDPGDVQTLTSYMKTLVESPSIRAQMGALGRRRALQMQWDATGREYLRVFEDTLGRHCASELATAS
jgi:glycosyltransferase involved in cell wall biosynthesis